MPKISPDAFSEHRLRRVFASKRAFFNFILTFFVNHRNFVQLSTQNTEQKMPANNTSDQCVKSYEESPSIDCLTFIIHSIS